MKNQTQCNLKGTQKLFFLQSGTASSCCRSYPEALPSNMSVLLDRWQQENQLLTQGIPVSNCLVCWKDQDQGRLSYRQKHGHQQDNYIELWIDNACNHMCSYCSPKFSSTWQQSIMEHGPFQKISASAIKNQALPTQSQNPQQWLGYIKDYLQDQPNDSVYLKLLGGEPLMQIKNLQKLIDISGPSIKELLINTNLNPPNNKFLKWLLDSVPAHKLKFEISLDASPNYNHVPRAGFDSNKFNENLQLLLDKKIKLGFLSVVSVLSIFDLPNFLTWVKSYGVNFDKINNPDCLDPVWLPVHVLDEIRNQLSQPPVFFQELYTKPQNLLDIKLFEQYNYLHQYFTRTGIDVEQIDNALFRQYWIWLKERQK